MNQRLSEAFGVKGLIYHFLMRRWVSYLKKIMLTWERFTDENDVILFKKFYSVLTQLRITDAKTTLFVTGNNISWKPEQWHQQTNGWSNCNDEGIVTDSAPSVTWLDYERLMWLDDVVEWHQTIKRLRPKKSLSCWMQIRIILYCSLRAT